MTLERSSYRILFVKGEGINTKICALRASGNLYVDSIYVLERNVEIDGCL
jgi:hypothetical protein